MTILKTITNFLGVLSPAHILFYRIASRSKKVGCDTAGNTYYEASARRGYKLSRRWVMYKETPEPSSVPPEWHAWLHHQEGNVPNTLENSQSFRQKWQKPHKGNMTGTNRAYFPKGHILSNKKRDKVCGDYEIWSPPQ